MPEGGSRIPLTPKSFRTELVDGKEYSRLEATGCIMETCLGPSESVNDYMKDLLLLRKGIISPMKFTHTVSNTALGDV